MFADVDSLHSELLGRDPQTFISRFIFEAVPFAFNDNLEQWIDWKHTLGDLIDVDPRNIVLTGSAAVGFSLNPEKNYKSFDASSDIDCGIISQYHFDVAWRYLMRRQTFWLSLPKQEKDAIRAHRKNFVFLGTIATDWFLHLLPFGGDWQAALDLTATIDPTIGRDIKMRIYKDYDALRYYQSSGISKLRAELFAFDDQELNIDHVEEFEIGTEE